MASIFDLFKKKEDCEICQSKSVVKSDRILADSSRLCENCVRFMDLEDENLERMSMEEFRDHLAYREENKKNLKEFDPTRTYDSSRGILMVDDFKKLWYFQKEGEENPPIFKFEETQSIRVRRREREGTLEEEDRGICSVLNDLELEIGLDNPYHKSFKISILEDSHITECSMLYTIYNDRLDKIFSIFESIIQSEK